MPKTTMHALDIRQRAEILNGGFVLITEAKEMRCSVECPMMDEEIIFSAQRLPGIIHEQTTSIGNVLPGLGDKN